MFSSFDLHYSVRQLVPSFRALLYQVLTLDMDMKKLYRNIADHDVKACM